MACGRPALSCRQGQAISSLARRSARRLAALVDIGLVRSGAQTGLEDAAVSEIPPRDARLAAPNYPLFVRCAVIGQRYT